MLDRNLIQMISFVFVFFRVYLNFHILLIYFYLIIFLLLQKCSRKRVTGYNPPGLLDYESKPLKASTDYQNRL